MIRRTFLQSVGLAGFTYEDCQPLISGDALAYALRWKRRRLDEVINQPIRLQFKWRDARIFAVAGRFHFLDAQDAQLLRDGQRIDPTLFDF